MPSQGNKDWTHGPAKIAAVALLGAAGLGGLGYSLATDRVPWRNAAARVEPSGEGIPNPSSSTSAQHAAKPIAIKVNINTGTRADLELLPGIGPALAERIIEDRTRFGPFKRIEDLVRVKGIGPKTIERFRDQATVGDAVEPTPK